MNPILSRDVEVRQAATEKCPDTYQTQNGLNFTSYCEQNNPGNGKHHHLRPLIAKETTADKWQMR
jgi:hypothetical protein